MAKKTKQSNNKPKKLPNMIYGYFYDYGTQDVNVGACKDNDVAITYQKEGSPIGVYMLSHYVQLEEGGIREIAL